MTKKTFKGMNTGRADHSADTDNVFAAIETGTTKRGQQNAASPAEIEERRSAMKTSGRKGAKAVRINMAFTPENYDFIRVCSRVSSKTMTGFCNMMLDEYRKNHPDLYKKTKALLDTL